MNKRIGRLPTITLRDRQNGAVLVISLLLLLVMTMLALSSMNSSTMQEKMAANAQHSNRTFQAAESAVSDLIVTVLGGASGTLNEAMISAGTYSAETAFDVGDPDVNATTQVRYLGQIILTGGNSINADEASTLLSGQRFELIGIGQVASVQARTRVRQGIEYN